MNESQITLLLPEPLPRRTLFYPLNDDRSGCSSFQLIQFVANYFGFEAHRIGLSRHYSSTISFEAGQHVALDWVTTGLLGGKGGFGAGLRAMGKTAAAKQSQPSMDFSLSRDLQGRRLGAANMALLIAKAKEEGKVDANSWLLEKPSWIDARKVEKHEKQFAKTKKDQQDLKDKSKAASVGSSKKSREAEFDVKLARELEEREQAVTSSVSLGLQRLKRQKLQSGAESEGQEDKEKPSSQVEKAPEGWKINSGIASISSSSPTSFVITGESEFATISWEFALSSFDVTLLTDGLVQVGFAKPTSLHAGMENDSDGVGDVKGSVAFDFARRLVWRDGEPANGMPIEDSEQVNDSADDELVTVRCELKQNKATFSLLQAEVNVDIESDNTKSGYVPAISLEKYESVEITFIPVESLPNSSTSYSSSSSSSSSASMDASSDEQAVTLESLKALGADKLKEELRSLGLKFGGSIEERARRLLIAKTIPKTEWPRSIFPN